MKCISQGNNLKILIENPSRSLDFEDIRDALKFLRLFIYHIYLQTYASMKTSNCRYES